MTEVIQVLDFKNDSERRRGLPGQIFQRGEAIACVLTELELSMKVARRGRNFAAWLRKEGTSPAVSTRSPSFRVEKRSKSGQGGKIDIITTFGLHRKVRTSVEAKLRKEKSETSTRRDDRAPQDRPFSAGKIFSGDFKRSSFTADFRLSRVLTFLLERRSLSTKNNRDFHLRSRLESRPSSRSRSLAPPPSRPSISRHLLLHRPSCFAILTL